MSDNVIKTKPKLWIVSELFYPEQTSTGYFLTRIAEGLAKTYEVHAICGQPSYSERGTVAPRREIYKGMTISRVLASHFNKDRISYRVINVVTLSLSVVFFMLWHFRKGDRMLIVTNPPTLPPFAALICRFKGVKSYLLVHDVYPEILSAAGFLKTKSLFYKLLRSVMRKTFCSYDRIITLGRDMQQLISIKTDLSVQKIDIIPNWGDIDEVVPVQREANAFAIEHGLTEQCIIQFSGNIGRTHDIESIIEAAIRLQHRSDILFLFVGYGGKTRIIDDSVAFGKSSNIKFLPRQPRELLGPMLACSDATIIAFEKAMKGISVPSRMYNVMSAGTPIIAMAEADSELAMVVGEIKAGWVVSQGDVEQLVQTITHIADTKNEAKHSALGQNGRNAVMQSYTLDHILQQYHKILA
jgi:glycosyltransferase involved in cell wall biosynthesis